MEFTIWMTTSCNFKCKYCYVDKQNITMSSDTAHNVVDYICDVMKDRSDENINIIFHGGEPFYNYRQIIFIYNELNRRLKNTMTFSVTTNGSFFNEDIKKFLQNSNVELCVSLDGNKKSNDSNRQTRNGCSSYDMVIDFLEKMRSIGKNIKIRMTVNTLNVKDLYKNYLHINQLGYDIISFAPDEGDKWTKKDLDIYKTNFHLILEYLKNKDIELYKYYRENIKNFYFMTISPCSGGAKSLHVSVDGTLYPCMLAVGKNKYKIGDIYDGIDIEKLKEIHKYSLEDNITCKNCGIKNNCRNNRCKIINDIRTHNFLFAYPISCAFQHINYEELF